MDAGHKSQTENHMTEYIRFSSLDIAEPIARLVAEEIAPGTGIDPVHFWQSYERILDVLAPQNAALLRRRDEQQRLIDEWFQQRHGKPFDVSEHRAFLSDIGYLAPEPEAFSIGTANVDPEMSELAGPQLVVPLMNARFALNAANARWGSLYDALYGTDAVDHTGALAPGTGYSSARGEVVVARAGQVLDEALPLAAGRHADVRQYELRADGTLSVYLQDGTRTGLQDPARFIGHARSGTCLSLLFRHHGLHIELQIDPTHPIGKASPAGVIDVVLEAALTTIQDCEDSVAAVDADDKAVVYRNWLGLMKGDLAVTFSKNGRPQHRMLADDRRFTSVDGTPVVLPGRSLLLVRHVGHLMTTDAIRDGAGRETPEGFLDAIVTTLASLHDLRKSAGPRNSRAGSIYVVKPKLHGPEEAALTDRLFGMVEEALGLERNTIKIGVMDEERRTSVNLQATIAAVRDRVAFINTGFLDRTGDEIRTSMYAGPVVPKNEIKNAIWLAAYENHNVDVGLAAGFGGKAQIGKGMWAKPDSMAEMLVQKLAHPQAGASTAWVPSPVAAVLHAVHYHQVDVRQRQGELAGRTPAKLDAILTPPLLDGRNLTEDEVRRELENNCQSILGYVVRWIDQGIGCSKVPDIDDVALMEDRATLRISSQHLGNWLLHGVASPEAVTEALRRMAVAVDRQNAADPAYRPMAPAYERSIAFQTASELIFRAVEQPNGYMEPILYRRRREAKAVQSREQVN